MKTTNLYYLLCAALLLFGCNNSSKKTAQTDSLATAVTDTILRSQCYMAIDGKDTAYLNINTLNSGIVTGDMKINFSINPDNDGTIEGKFIGDTLFADYTFTTEINKEKQNKNPLAFLKTGERLTLGIGVIETSLGKSYFVKDKPINFERGRFKFDPIECIN